MASIRLSFDDGPKPLNALDSILNTLKTYSILADFYVNGREVNASDATREATKRIYREGHLVENHAWTHDRLDRMPLAEVDEEVGRTQELITSLIGRAPTRLRPPYGAGAFSRPMDPDLVEVAKKYNLKITLWDLDTRDWERPAGLVSKIDKILSDAARLQNRNTIEVLMHILPTTGNDLDDLIKH